MPLREDVGFPWVTPFVGVWIETSLARCWSRRKEVTPFVGVWIETGGIHLTCDGGKVTPFVGVWIET